MAEIKFGDLLIDVLIEDHPLVRRAKQAAILREFAQELASARLDGEATVQKKQTSKSVPTDSGKTARKGFGEFDPT